MNIKQQNLYHLFRALTSLTPKFVGVRRLLGKERCKQCVQRVCVGMHRGKDKHLQSGTAVLCADIHMSSMTWEWLRSVVRLDGFCLLRERQEEVRACVMWVLLTLFVVVISHVKRNHRLLQLDGK